MCTRADVYAYTRGHVDTGIVYMYAHCIQVYGFFWVDFLFACHVLLRFIFTGWEGRVLDFFLEEAGGSRGEEGEL